MRYLRGEDAASGIFDNVVEKAQRAVHGAVLVVDERIGMTAVGLGDETCGRVQILIAPGAQLQFGGKVHAGTSPAASQRLHQEETLVQLEPRLAEEDGMRSRWVEQQLRLDAIDLRRIEQGFKEMTEQGFFDCVGRPRPHGEVAGGWLEKIGMVAGKGEHVADDCLGFLIDAEGVAGNLA